LAKKKNFRGDGALNFPNSQSRVRKVKPRFGGGKKKKSLEKGRQVKERVYGGSGSLKGSVTLREGREWRKKRSNGENF